MKVEVKEIILKIGEKELRLTVEEGRELMNQLKNLFDGQITYVYPCAPTYVPTYWPPTPHWQIETTCDTVTYMKKEI